MAADICTTVILGVHEYAWLRRTAMREALENDTPTDVNKVLNRVLREAMQREPRTVDEVRKK